LKSPRFGERLLTNATTNLHGRLLRAPPAATPPRRREA
jgi:hypothetical protein